MLETRSANARSTADEAVALVADTNAATDVTVVVTIVAVATLMLVTAAVDSFQVGIGQLNFADRAGGEAAQFRITQAQTILFVFPYANDIHEVLLPYNG
jgi:hypothetical protein